MVAPFPITEAQITGLFVESVLFGIHLITAGYCMRALMSTSARWKSRDEINWAMLVVSLLLLSNATFDVVLGFYHNLKAFVFYTGQGGPAEEFTNISDWINVSKVRGSLVNPTPQTGSELWIFQSLTVVVQTMIGDGMLVRTVKFKLVH